jgi:hypothetical protein
MFQDVLRVPDLLSILLNASIGAEEAHPRHSCDCLGEPFLLVLVRLIDEILRVDVALEIIRDEIVIAMFYNAVDQSTELTSIAECTIADGVEDPFQLRIDLEAAVEVSVTKILDVFGEVAEEEDIILADLSCNFDVGAVTGA